MGFRVCSATSFIKRSKYSPTVTLSSTNGLFSATVLRVTKSHSFTTFLFLFRFLTSRPSGSVNLPTQVCSDFDQKIDPDEPKVEGFLNDALAMTSAIFFVNTSNQFEYSVYGPIDFQQSIDNYGTTEIIKSSFTNDINDYYNKISLKYGWDFDKGEYAKTLVGTQDDWSILNERLFEIEMKLLA